MGTSEVMSCDSYSIKEVTLAARPYDIKTISQPVKLIANPVQMIYTINTLLYYSRIIKITYDNKQPLSSLNIKKQSKGRKTISQIP